MNHKRKLFLKHKKAVFVPFRALVYFTTLEFLVLKSSSNHVFLLKLHLTKYIHTRAHKLKERNPNKTSLKAQLSECILVLFPVIVLVLSLECVLQCMRDS